MYDIFGREYYWRHIVNDVYLPVKNRQTCPKKTTAYRQQKTIQVVSRNEPLELVVIDNTARFPKSFQVNQLVVVPNDRYSKPTRTVQTVKELFCL